MLCAQRSGQLSGRAANCACRHSVCWICASLPNRPQITQNAVILEKRNLQFRGAQAAGLYFPAACQKRVNKVVCGLREASRQAAEMNKVAACAPPEPNALRPSHV